MLQCQVFKYLMAYYNYLKDYPRKKRRYDTQHNDIRHNDFQ